MNANGPVTPERPTVIERRLADTRVDHAVLARGPLTIGLSGWEVSTVCVQ